MADRLRRGTPLSFEVTEVLALTPAQAWASLTDWAGHAEWVPATIVDVDPDDPGRFTAFTGWGPLRLEDRMRVVSAQFADGSGECMVEKLGPHLFGAATFSVAPGPTPVDVTVCWREDLVVRRLPRLAVPVVCAATKRAFRRALRRLENLR